MVFKTVTLCFYYIGNYIRFESVLVHYHVQAIKFSESGSPHVLSRRSVSTTCATLSYMIRYDVMIRWICLYYINPLNPELNPICYLLALLAHHFLHVSRIRVKLLTFRRLMSYTYGAPILDVSRSHTTTQHSR